MGKSKAVYVFWSLERKTRHKEKCLLALKRKSKAQYEGLRVLKRKAKNES